MTAERVGIFVRLPARQVSQLDRAAATAGMKKQEYLSRLLNDRLAGTSSGRVTAEATSNAIHPAGSVDVAVLSLPEAAEFLRIDEARILVRAERGEIPGRHFEGEWRFSRAALLEWLQGSDRKTDGPGFRKSHQPPKHA